MNLVIVLGGSFNEYSFIMSVNDYFVRTVSTNRRGPRDEVDIKFLFVTGRWVCG